MTLLPDFLAILSGSAVGFSLGLIGGGGSILAVPLLLYVVGIASPHLAIGTSAVAVSANAFANLINHGRQGNVAWGVAGIFAAAGVAGAAIGSELGKRIDGQHLLLLFALVMMVIAVAMLRRREAGGSVPIVLSPAVMTRLLLCGGLTGLMSGFFGIGGGFLIVPALIFAAGLPMLKATASSLFAVGAFGLTTAVNYSLSGLVDWVLAGEFIAGGILGGLGGIAAATRLARRKNLLTRIFATAIFVVALYMIYRTLSAA